MVCGAVDVSLSGRPAPLGLCPLASPPGPARLTLSEIDPQKDKVTKSVPLGIPNGSALVISANSNTVVLVAGSR